MRDQRGFTQALILLIALAAIGLGVFLTKHPTFFRPKAANETTFHETSMSLEAGLTDSNGLIPIYVLARSDIDAANLFAAKLKFDPKYLTVDHIQTLNGPIGGPPVASDTTSPSPSSVSYISNDDDGKTFTIPQGKTTSIILKGIGNSINDVSLDPQSPYLSIVPDVNTQIFGSFYDPKNDFQVTLYGASPGKTDVTVTTRPSCASNLPCPLYVRVFKVSIIVSPFPDHPNPSVTAPHINCISDSECPTDYFCYAPPCVGTGCNRVSSYCQPNSSPIPSPSSPDTGFIQNWIDQSFDNSAGTISLVAGVPNPGFETPMNYGPAEMAIVYFKPVSGVQGSTQITFDDSSAIYRNSDNVNILTIKNPLTIYVGNSPSPTPSCIPHSACYYQPNHGLLCDDANPGPGGYCSPSPSPEGNKCLSDSDCSGGQICQKQITNPICEVPGIGWACKTTGFCVVPSVSPSPSPSSTPHPGNGDANGDGKVDYSDLSILLSHYGETQPAPTVQPVDLNGDNVINAFDLSKMIQLLIKNGTIKAQ